MELYTIKNVFRSRQEVPMLFFYTLFLLTMSELDGSIFESLTAIPIFVMLYSALCNASKGIVWSPVVAILLNIAQIVLTLLVNYGGLKVIRTALE